MKNIFKLAAFIFCILPLTLMSQLQVTGGQTANDLANNILGSGVTISNAVLTSSTNATGTFTNGNTTNIGVNEGILLTSGSINNAIGPNSSTNTSTNNNASGDSDLDALITTQSLDAAILEFDFIPEGTSISFNYVFASEEYEEYYCSNFNDVFAFFVSGPNPLTGNYVNQNIALAPTSGDVVSINNVGPGTCAGIDNSAEYNNNFTGTTIEYDGFLNVFTASIALVPCQTYHLKLAIADAGDRILDSGVFIEAGSFVSSNVIAEAVVINPTCPGGSDGSIDVSVISGVSPYTFLWNDGVTSEDRTDLTMGTYSVEITDAISCSVESFTYTLVDDIDITGPELTCNDITVSVDENGDASITVDDVASATDICGVDELGINLSSFSCLLQDYDVLVTTTDVNGNSSTCIVTVTLIGDDSDCDGVADACDLCPGGDDQVDNDGDGNPDCAYPPAFENIIDAWKCSSKKVFMCHVPPGNPANAHTICVSKNAISAHLAHGDYLGPCGNASCESKLSSDIPNRTKNTLSVQIYPNPASDLVTLKLDNLDEEATIEVMNHLGKRIAIYRNSGQYQIIDFDEMQLISGLYFISITTENDLIVKKLIINR